jgi:hypothetical protein
MTRKIYHVLKNGKIIESTTPGKYAGYRRGKIFGRLDCGSGMRMKKENRVFFLAWADAIAEGYRPCKNCRPTPESIPGRVFVPLTKESFEDFRRGKTYEVRRAERQWSEKNLRAGRRVTVSCGYSGARIEGTIGRVITGSLRDILRRIPIRKIEPRAENRHQAFRMNFETLGAAPRYIAFEIKFA